jgi:hypothetical protein
LIRSTLTSSTMFKCKYLAEPRGYSSANTACGYTQRVRRTHVQSIKKGIIVSLVVALACHRCLWFCSCRMLVLRLLLRSHFQGKGPYRQPSITWPFVVCVDPMHPLAIIHHYTCHSHPSALGMDAVRALSRSRCGLRLEQVFSDIRYAHHPQHTGGRPHHTHAVVPPPLAPVGWGMGDGAAQSHHSEKVRLTLLCLCVCLMLVLSHDSVNACKRSLVGGPHI